jgi:hypothetical protein
MKYFQSNPLPPGEKYADVIGFNDYLAYNNHVWEPRHPEIGVGAKAAEVREIMEAHGQKFGLAITELSASSTDAAGVSMHQQAREAAQMLVQGFFYKLETLIWWTFDDYGDDCDINPNCKNWKFGIVDENLNPKLSFESYKTATEELRGWKPKEAQDDWNLVRFTFKRGEFEKHVYYSKLESGVSKNFAAKTMLVTDMYGNKTFYRHTGDKRIRITIPPDPIYVEINP